MTLTAPVLGISNWPRVRYLQNKNMSEIFTEQLHLLRLCAVNINVSRAAPKDN